MSHTVEAIYEGVLKLEQPLPLNERQRVRVTVESLPVPHSVLDIRPVSLGQPLLTATDGDLLGEMLRAKVTVEPP